ncbi:dihydroflavonol-4-reductase [Setomelanomma holmii]|uniref:Dihydroflavonol-4-reductase n=1 Tax=Setomelanomma holmii TaxID=210430 RepID=A0A9P4HI96_9PLEO|nr:dihydroflavonol-4-reductase [Setomelanomma holmii]
MSTVAIQPGATIFVTGVNGLIGSYVADQLLIRGYNVRGAVRDVEKTKWLKEFFVEKYKIAKFDLVGVPDMTTEGCYDDHVKGIEGFVHVAAPVGGILDIDEALNLGRNAALNALKACAKTPTVTRFVTTSSSFAASFPKTKLDHDFVLDETTFHDTALEQAKTAETPTSKGMLVYAAMKSETEKEMWKWVKENKPSFVMNSVLPNANFGPLLVPKHQGLPSTVAWIYSAFSGEGFHQLTSIVDPQWYISPLDDALLHVSALIHSNVDGERIFGYAERWNWNQILEILRKAYPEKTFPMDVEGQSDDRVVPPTKRSQEVLKWVKGSGWTSLKESVVALSKQW